MTITLEAWTWKNGLHFRVEHELASDPVGHGRDMTEKKKEQLAD